MSREDARPCQILTSQSHCAQQIHADSGFSQEPFLLAVPFLVGQIGNSLWSCPPALPQLSSCTALSPWSADTMEAVVALERGQPIVWGCSHSLL